MALSSSQLADLVEKLKLIGNIQDDNEALVADALAIYNDGGNSETTATVQVKGTDLILETDVDVTVTLDLTAAANDTLEELVAVINATNQWVATLLARDSTVSTYLYRKAATNALLQANEVTLEYENQELLEIIVQQAYEAVITDIGRGIFSASYTEIVDYPQASRVVMLQQPNVTSVSMVGTDLVDGLTVKYTGSDTNARVEITDTGLVYASRAGSVTTSAELLFSSLTTTTTLAGIVNAIAGWTSAVVNDRPSAYLVRQGVRDAKDTTVTLECWQDDVQEYEVDYLAGVLEFPAPARYPGYGFYGSARRPRLYVEYTAGWATMPVDLEAVVLGVAKDALETAIGDTGLLGETLGDYSYSQSVTAFNQRTIAATMDSHENTLARYRRMTV